MARPNNRRKIARRQQDQRRLASMYDAKAAVAAAQAQPVARAA